jgi:hypothetical protein
MKTAARGSEVCAFTKVLTDLASSIRRGGSMRAHWVLPTMRVVTEERPSTEAMWWWVWRGIVGFYFPLGDDSDEGICLRLRGCL